jgi:hypothetical protein
MPTDKLARQAQRTQIRREIGPDGRRYRDYEDITPKKLLLSIGDREVAGRHQLIRFDLAGVIDASA